MGKVYAVISGKGGVGKTTSAINLGFSLNELGKETVVVDANLTTPNIGINLGSPVVPITLNHVIKGEARVEEAIYEHETGTKILLSSLSVDELKNLKHEKIPEVAKKLKKIADVVILDSSAGLGEEARATLKAADEVVIVTNPEISAVTDALKTIKLAEQLNKKIAGVIISRHQGKKWELSQEIVRDMLEYPLLGVVPEDASVKESLKMKNAVLITHPKSKASRAYRKIAKRLIGLNEDESFFRKLLKKLGLG